MFKFKSQKEALKKIEQRARHAVKDAVKAVFGGSGETGAPTNTASAPVSPQASTLEELHEQIAQARAEKESAEERAAHAEQSTADLERQRIEEAKLSKEAMEAKSSYEYLKRYEFLGNQMASRFIGNTLTLTEDEYQQLELSIASEIEQSPVDFDFFELTAAGRHSFIKGAKDRAFEIVSSLLRKGRVEEATVLNEKVLQIISRLEESSVAPTSNFLDYWNQACDKRVDTNTLPLSPYRP